MSRRDVFDAAVEFVNLCRELNVTADQQRQFLSLAATGDTDEGADVEASE